MRRSQQDEGFQDGSPLPGGVRERLLQRQGCFLQHSQAFPCATVRCVFTAAARAAASTQW